MKSSTRRCRRSSSRRWRKGVAIELLNHPDGVHAFDILTDDARTREIIKRAVEFSGEHSGAN